MITSILQTALSLLLAVQSNPTLPVEVKQQALQAASAAVARIKTSNPITVCGAQGICMEMTMAYEKVGTSQVLGRITSQEDGHVWKAASEPLVVQWEKVRNGDAASWSNYARIDLEGNFNETYAHHVIMSPEGFLNTGSYTITPRTIPPGKYRLYVIGTHGTEPDPRGWAMTPSVDIVVE